MEDKSDPRSHRSGNERKVYEKPKVESHRVFEVSLSCIKIPGSPMCQFNVHRTKS